MQAIKTDNPEQIQRSLAATPSKPWHPAMTLPTSRIAPSSVLRWSSPGVGHLSDPIARNCSWATNSGPSPFPWSNRAISAFDSEAGKREVLARRIGRNELDVIDLCQAYVDWQKEYAADSHDGKKAGVYAQHLRSTPGHRNGLFWETNPGEKPSPIGDLAAYAADEGHAQSRTEGSPFWGYRYRILTAQGASAPGGQKSYVANGDMRGGFALVAYPALYGSSGVMTFVVNQDGSVYEKDLGKDTSALAANMTEYNPDSSWERVETTP